MKKSSIEKTIPFLEIFRKQNFSTYRIFWTHTGEHPRIESAAMDGSDRRIVVAKQMILPSDLALDFPNRRLYWTDVKKKTVETVNYDGSDRHVVKAFSRGGSCPAIEERSSNIYQNSISWRFRSPSNRDDKTLVYVSINIGEIQYPRQNVENEDFFSFFFFGLLRMPFVGRMIINICYSHVRLARMCMYKHKY